MVRHAGAALRPFPSIGRRTGARPLDKGDAWHSLPVDEVIRKLETDAELGLTEAEAAARLARIGRNEAASAEAGWGRVLLRQFRDVLVAVLLAAAVLSLVIGHVRDALVIAAILVINALLGFAQEWRAERALAALRTLLAPQARVVREGRPRTIPAAELAPGDLVLVTGGDRAPADLRLIEANALAADESALTGESVPVSKSAPACAAETPLAERRSGLWMGTGVSRGTGRGLVIGTGEATELGKVARLTAEVETQPTPLQRRLASLGRQLAAVGFGVAALVAGLGLALEMPLADVVMTGISLAVAVVPEGLPAVVTITLALGVRAMAGEGALLRRLRAAETLGAATALCVDKTGTLTLNEMVVQQIWTAEGVTEAELLDSALQCCDAEAERGPDGRWRVDGDPTEGALVVAAYEGGRTPADRRERLAERPFDPDTRRMAVQVGGEAPAWHVKGAVDVVLDACRPGADREGALGATAAMGDAALRVLSIARGPAGGGSPDEGLELLGVVGMADPPRPETPTALRRAREAGIRVFMITGDAAATAGAVAGRIGLEFDAVVTGRDLDGMDDASLAEALEGAPLFARTTPEHKLRVIDALQRAGEVVGMTGDGVNDAPALKKADIGIAMGRRGTDVARGASDLVLTDDDFASIVSAVAEGRRQYDSIQKFVRFLLSSNFGEVFAILATLGLGRGLVLLAPQILWVNLVTDGLVAVALGLEAAEPGSMARPPRRVDAPLLGRPALTDLLVFGACVGLIPTALFVAHSGDGLEIARTMAFHSLVVTELFAVFVFRTLRAPLVETSLLGNRWLIAAWLVTVGLQLSVAYVPALTQAFGIVPLPAQAWAVIVAAALPILPVGELIKWRRARRPPPSPTGPAARASP